MQDRLIIEYQTSRLPFLLVTIIWLIYSICVILARTEIAFKLILLLAGVALWWRYLVVLAKPAVAQLACRNRQWFVRLPDSQALVPVSVVPQKTFVSSWLLVPCFRLEGRCLPLMYFARDNTSEAQFRALCRQLLL